MANITKDIGPVSAYAVAVAHGYQGTEEEWATLQMQSGVNAQRAETAANAAYASAQSAAASEANTANSAQTAQNAAASAAASQTEAEKQAENALVSANQAAGSATNAANSASAAAASAAEANAVKESIPADYTVLTQEVGKLSEEILQAQTRLESRIQSHQIRFPVPQRPEFVKRSGAYNGTLSDIHTVSGVDVLYGFAGASVLRSGEGKDYGNPNIKMTTPSSGATVNFVKKLDDDSLLVGVENAGGAGVAKVYKGTPEVWNASASKFDVTWTEVLACETKNLRFSMWFGLSIYKNIIVVGEYGGHNVARSVYISRDYGDTWAKIFTADLDDSGAGVHIHDVCYDPYSDVIWICTGDGYWAQNIYWSYDGGTTWNKNYEYKESPSQFTQILPLPNCILFTSDNTKHMAVYRCMRDQVHGKKTHLELEHAYSYYDNYDAESPIGTNGCVVYGKDACVYFGWAERYDVAKTNSPVIATKDGYTFYEVWSDDDTSAASSGYCGIYGVYGVSDNGNIAISYTNKEANTTNRHSIVMRAPDWRSWEFNDFKENGGADVVVDETLTQEGQAADAKAVGEKIKVLSEEIAKSPTSNPRVYIDGAIPTTKDNVLAEMRVVSSWLNFHAYIKIKCQGTSSMAYDKKNFTITLYQDEARTIPLYITIPGWKVASNKFVFKANWIDHSHARNVICARLWSEVVASRSDYDTLPVQLRNSPNNGAVDGFPIIVTTNGTYQGVYTWNIGKDAWLFGMDENNPNHALLCNEDNSAYLTSTNFYTPWNGDENKFAIEVGTASDALTTALNDLIACVTDTDDATFKATIGTYLDVQSAIDYYLHQYVICGLDGLGKNMLLATYDHVKWYLSAYDMDSVHGLWWTGEKFVSAEYRCPYDYEQPNSNLFNRICHVFREEMIARYAELRKTVYSYANIMRHFEEFCGLIGTELYADDLVTYPNIPSADGNNIWQLRNYIRDRLHNYCDPHMLGNSAPTIVEYIEGDGNSWINTDIYPDNDMVIDISLLNPAQENAMEHFFGTFGDLFAFYHYAAAYVRFRINQIDYGANFGIDGFYSTTTKRTRSFDLSVDTSGYKSPYPLLLFTRRKSAEYFAFETCGTYRLYSFKITRKSTSEVLLDMLPAVDAEGRPGMYDSVTQRMFYNDGTGAFAIPAATETEEA